MAYAHADWSLSAPLRQPNRVVVGVRFAATAVVTLKGFAAAVGRMPYAPTPAVRLGNFNRTGLYRYTPLQPIGARDRLIRQDCTHSSRDSTARL